MTFRNTAAAVLILAATTAWTQTASTTNPRAVMATSDVAGTSEQSRTQSATRLRVEEMGANLAKMHTLLKQMQAKNAAASTKDPIIRGDLEMWGLMLSDLDKQYEQLRAASHSREELDARRAALYKQAEARAAAARTQATPAAAPSPAPAAPAETSPASASPATTAPTSSPN